MFDVWCVCACIYVDFLDICHLHFVFAIFEFVRFFIYLLIVVTVIF